MDSLLKRGLMLLILLSSCASSNTTTEITPDAWREDLRYLAQELPGRHVNAFHSISRESFAGEVTRLDAAIPHLNNDEVLAGFMRIVALIGDGHTHLDLPPSSLRYPMELKWFDDELRVIAAQDPYHDAVGARILAIGSTPIRDVMDRAVQLVPRGENDGRTRLIATTQLTSPEVLHGLDVIEERDSAPFILELATGERGTIALSPARLGDFSTWRMAAEKSHRSICGTWRSPGGWSFCPMLRRFTFPS